MTRGVACRTANCKTRLHNHCLHKYRRRNQACPSCATPWPADQDVLLLVGEGAIRSGRSRAVARSQVASNDRDNEDDEDDAVDNEEDDASQESELQSQPQ